MSATEMHRYMAAQREAIAEAHEQNAPYMALDLYALLWLDTHAVTFRTAWEG